MNGETLTIHLIWVMRYDDDDDYNDDDNDDDDDDDDDDHVTIWPALRRVHRPPLRRGPFSGQRSTPVHPPPARRRPRTRPNTRIIFILVCLVTLCSDRCMYVWHFGFCRLVLSSGICMVT